MDAQKPGENALIHSPGHGRTVSPEMAQVRKPLAAIQSLAWIQVLLVLPWAAGATIRLWSEPREGLVELFWLLFLGASWVCAIHLYRQPVITSRWLIGMLATSTIVGWSNTGSWILTLFSGLMMTAASYLQVPLDAARRRLEAAGQRLEGAFNLNARLRQQGFAAAVMFIPLGVVLAGLTGLAYETVMAHSVLPDHATVPIRPTLKAWRGALRSHDADLALSMATVSGQERWPDLLDVLEEAGWNKEGVLLRRGKVSQWSPDRCFVYDRMGDAFLISDWVLKDGVWRLDRLRLDRKEED